MKAMQMIGGCGRWGRMAGLAAGLLTAFVIPAPAQTTPSPSQGVLGVWTDNGVSSKSASPSAGTTEPLPGLAGNARPVTDPNGTQAGCPSCGRGLLGGPGDFYMGPGSTDSCAGGCGPRRRKCACC